VVGGLVTSAEALTRQHLQARAIEAVLLCADGRAAAQTHRARESRGDRHFYLLRTSWRNTYREQWLGPAEGLPDHAQSSNEQYIVHHFAMGARTQCRKIASNHLRAPIRCRLIDSASRQKSAYRPAKPASQVARGRRWEQVSNRARLPLPPPPLAVTACLPRLSQAFLNTTPQHGRCGGPVYRVLHRGPSIAAGHAGV
jgi:hypothetical protein